MVHAAINNYLLSVVYYKFDRRHLRDLSSTSVSAMYADCGSGDNICPLVSAVKATKLPITTELSNNLPNSDSNCVVNSVDIIHDCMPRCVDLKFTFSSYSDKLYLKVWNMILQICTPEVIAKYVVT